MLSSNWYAPAVGSVRYLTIVYDAQGRRSSTNRASSWTYYGYDAVSRLALAQHSFASGSANSTTTFAYNPASQIVTQARDNDAYAFTGYTTASTSYVANGLNQYASVGGAALAYDANGNLTSNGATSYAYDVENRLISASSGVTLDYDPAGRLWRMTAGSTVTAFLYDGDQLLEERDGSGVLLRRYVHGAGEDDPLLWYEGVGLTDRRSLQADHQGSIVSVADAGGNALGINSYDEYGVPAATNSGRFQYTGQVYLPELGFYYYKARIYWPGGGRFLQTDPIGYKDQNNLYAYVGNDPTDGRDPSGLRCMFESAGHCDDGTQSAERAGPTDKKHQSQSTGSQLSGKRDLGAASTATSGVSVMIAAQSDGAKLTGATAKDLRPLKVLGGVATAAAGAAKYGDLRDHGYTPKASAGGALVSTGTGIGITATGAFVGELIFPPGGGLVGGLVAGSLDLGTGSSDSAGEGAADILDGRIHAAPPMNDCSMCQMPR